MGLSIWVFWTLKISLLNKWESREKKVQNPLFQLRKQISLPSHLASDHLKFFVLAHANYALIKLMKKSDTQENWNKIPKKN